MMPASESARIRTRTEESVPLHLCRSDRTRRSFFVPAEQSTAYIFGLG